MVLPSIYKAMVVEKAGGPFKLIERLMPTPGKTQVLIKVEACGICHSVSFVGSYEEKRHCNSREEFD